MKINKEQDLLKRNAVLEKELAAKNAELKIEASLERVRAVAMGMKKSDDLLNICEILFVELEVLGFKDLRNTVINIYNEEKGSFLSYDCFGHGETGISSSNYNSHPVIEKVTEQIRGTRDAFVEILLSGKELEDWKNFRKVNGEIDDLKLKNAVELYYYFYSIGTGALGISTLKPVTAVELEVLKRFRNVFDLSYRRYLDIIKAQAQAREAQIEAALERVRSKSMSMHHSDDLITVINIVQEQLLGLGFHFHAANFVTDYSEKGYTMWLASPGESFPYKIYVPQVGLKYFAAVNAAIEKGSDFAIYTLNFEEKNIYFKNLFENSLAKNTSEHAKRMVFESKGMAASVVLLDKIRLNLMNLDLIPFTDEENNILKRFGYVFEQSYTRFLDLQKAESQAREAQIEAALEKVRSRSLAMHQSSELEEVIMVVSEQLQQLQFRFHNVSFVRYNDKKGLNFWLASPGRQQPFLIEVPYLDNPVFNRPLEAFKKGVDFIADVLTPEENHAWLKHLIEHFGVKNFSEEDNKNLLNTKSYARSLVLMKHILLVIGNFAAVPYTEEQNLVLKRFANVFDQAYTRFLDLQKAEAQAKEAQIEAALERVRSRSMAMHKSDELREVVAVLFAQLQHIGFDIKFCTIALIDKVNSTVEFWLSGFSQEILPESYHVPNLDHPFYQNFQNTFRQGTPYKVFELAGEEKGSYDKLWFTLTDFKNLPEPVKKPMMEMERVVLSCAFTKNGMIQIGGFEPLSDIDASIVQRFAKVFEQTHTRFLDLQKAEEQVREAQIEAALERVRSRTMAMHQTSELQEVIHTVHKELLNLNLSIVGGSFVVINDDVGEELRCWGSGGTANTSTEVQVPHFNLPFCTNLMKGIKKGPGFLTEEFSQEEKKEYFTKLFKHKPWSDLSSEQKNETLSSLGGYTRSAAVSKYTTIFIINHYGRKFTTSENDILSRFAKVFEQTYTRFLDLQKAEAQAREAQIETGLERVRSKTMAMHKSEEVTGVAVSLNEELLKLGFEGGSTIIIINRETGDTEQWTGFSEDKSLKSCYVPYFKHPCHNAVLDAWKKGEKILVYILAGQEKRSLDEHYFTTGYKIFPENDKKWMREMGSVTFSHAFMKYGAIHWGPDHLTEEQLRILQRFSKVFEQSYTRFLDLQKAEAQAREAQIEAALERVRAKVMAMTNSKELNATSLVFGEQLRKLGIDWQFSYFWLIDESKNENTFWITWPDYKTSLTIYTIAEAEEYFNDCLVSWRAGVKIHDNYVPPEGVQAWLDTFQRIADDAGGEAKKIMVPQTFPNGVFYYDAMMKYGSFGICISKPATDEEKKIQCRFAIEFERAYTRFLDLKQAEAQAREAQIELGLERVRARAMAMQKSDELKELIATVSTELSKLDLILDRCFIMTYDVKTLGATWWMANPETSSDPIGLYVKYHEQAPYLAFLKAWQDRIIKWQYILEGSVKKTWDKFLFVETELSRLPSFVIDNMRANEKVYLSASFNNFGCLTLATLEPLSDEQFDIMLRFAKVFDLTYTRFNDLKQAEAQAREAQIELGLERVRARAMAMQNSDELNDLVAILFEELTKLDLVLARCIIWILDGDELSARLWMANSEDKKAAESYYIKRLQHSYYESIIRGWKERKTKWVYDLKGDEKKTIDKLLLNETELSHLPETVKNGILNPEHTIVSGSFNNFGLLEASGPVELSDEQMDIVSRFAKVFDLTYTRFNDLKQAEAQAREAKIEAALERVRSKAMAMHKSEDLNAAVATVFEELDKLNIGILRCGIAIMDKEKPRADVWITVKSEQTNTIQVSGNEPLDYHPLLRGAYDNWIKHEDFTYVLQGEDLLSYYRDVATIKYQLPVSTPFDKEKIDQQQFYFNAVFQDGSLFAFMETSINDEAKMVMKRFANVFNLTYKRFLDLQKAEAQTREAKIEAALERVRARALAMQQPEELKDVAQVLRNEMGALGVEELETCSIYIHGDSSEKVECWYALQDPKHTEKKMVSDHFVLNLDDTWVGREMKKFYSSNEKQTSVIMQGTNRKEWIKYCYEHSPVFSGFYGETIPDRTYHLYKFSHGYIGAAAPGDISIESWKLLSRAASVFSLAYSRFKDLTQARNDLIQLKEEKKRAEDALTELQTTQKQLIQSEKMASLGELTAGIAHEIQNPLNFVNNFSDVSNELLEEMKAELEKGNAEEAKAIAVEVKENLEKILHHGKRADAIVKGMLQHSRTSSGHKELTDINTLADEYLRLAYHGLRAKDKFFNAKFETHFDPSLNKINIVPQEIGRVILNLINNSFYAVSEKKKVTGNGYEATVIVSTRKVDDTVEIKVKDNGNGIPQKVLDKIFQPFFTTKPTGQGTGLGLSLSYDIITKGHGGEINVKTKEGEGSEFIISLPMN